MPVTHMKVIRNVNLVCFLSMLWKILENGESQIEDAIRDGAVGICVREGRWFIPAVGVPSVDAPSFEKKCTL